MPFQILLNTYISRKFDCMKNKAIPLKGLPTVFKYPGVHYTFDRQCHLEYNDKYSAWTGRVSV